MFKLWKKGRNLPARESETVPEVQTEIHIRGVRVRQTDIFDRQGQTIAARRDIGGRFIKTKVLRYW